MTTSSLFNPRDKAPYNAISIFRDGNFVEYSTIGAAVSDAATGETIYVPPGTYTTGSGISVDDFNIVGLSTGAEIKKTTAGVVLSTPASSVDCYVENITIHAVPGATTAVDCVALAHTGGTIVFRGCVLLFTGESLSDMMVDATCSGDAEFVYCELRSELTSYSGTRGISMGGSGVVTARHCTITGNIINELYQSSGTLEVGDCDYDTDNTVGTITYLDGDRSSIDHSHTGGNLDWDTAWNDAVHSHGSDAEGGKLAWTTIWQTDNAIHNHADNAGGGVLNRKVVKTVNLTIGRDVTGATEILAEASNYGVSLPDDTISYTRAASVVLPPNYDSGLKVWALCWTGGGSGLVYRNMSASYNTLGENYFTDTVSTGYGTESVTVDQQVKIGELSIPGAVAGDIIHASLYRDANGSDTLETYLMVNSIVFEWIEEVIE